MPPTKVVIHGATGRMGTETVNAVCLEDDLTLVGATCGRERGSTLPIPGGGEVPLSSSMQDVLADTKPDVVVDFTNAAVCRESVAVAAAHSCNIVVGVSGLVDEDLQRLDALANDSNIGIIVAPNFALGAVVLKKLVEQAAPYFDYVDIVEAHHEAKIDAPSGFAYALAQAIGNGKAVHPQLPGEGNPGRDPGRRIQWRYHPQHPYARPQRPPRGNFRGRRPDRFHPPRHPDPRLLYARRNPVHPRSCEQTGPCGRLGKRTGVVAAHTCL